MSYEFLVIVIFFCSLIGMGVILFRKIPILAELPEREIPLIPENFFLKLKQKLGSIKSISFERFLQKFLSRLKILSLKTENKTSNWLERLRQKSLREKKNFSDDYWKKIRKGK